MSTFLRIIDDTPGVSYVRCDQILEIDEDEDDSITIETHKSTFHVTMGIHEFIQRIESMKVELPL